MKDEVQEFMSEQTLALAGQAKRFRNNPERFMRKALVDSADGLKSLKRPLRMVAHSGVKLTEVSQSTLESLIELQSEAVTATLTALATRLERAAGAEGVIDLVFDQIEMLPATRDRIVDEAGRAVEIFSHAGRDVRTIANHAYATVTGRTDEELAAAKKTTARVRKERFSAKREVTSKAAARSASKTLSSSSTGKASKSAAGSALSQRKAPKRTTSPAAASAASKTLRDGRTSRHSKSAAGSALAQRNAPSKRR